MTSFKDFFKMETNNGKLSSSYSVATVSSAVMEGLTSSVNRLATSASIISLSKSDKKEFADQVGDLVESEEFVTELSDQIGKPQPGESEDEFVERAKNAMKKLMRAKLAGKS